MAKTTYMIAHGASVVIVRDGARVSIPAGGGADFTDAEILAINKAAPGSLRNPVNEGRGKSAPVVEEAEDEGKKDSGKTETAAQKKQRLADEKKAAAAAAKSDGSDDDDDDEDI